MSSEPTMRLHFFAVVACFIASTWGLAAKPGPISDDLRRDWKLDRFYQKTADAKGLPVVGSDKVSDNALAEAAWIVERMLEGREDIRKAMIETRVRVVVMAATEYTTDIPDHRRLQPKLFWDRRARGLGATPSNPAVSCGEENLLGYPGDPYPKENIFVHEFAHAIHGTDLNKVDPTFDKRLKAAYQAALERGLWKNTYAASNASEYWAEGVQCWFDDNAPADALHNEIRTREQLKSYDKALAKLCEEAFGDKKWRYLRPAQRPEAERQHLLNYDPSKLPRFGWREVPIGERARVTIQTALGDFEVQIDSKSAPEAATLFLRIALDGGYHSGRFLRSRIATMEPLAGIAIAEPKPNWAKDAIPRLKLPEVPASTAKPGDGTLALVRKGPTLGAFAIIVGTPMELPEDLVPLGQVVKGMDVVKKLLQAPAEQGALKPPVDIRRVIRSE
jgi:cyclophilin family peptidyl-prolyl cis-trans isomerase